MLAKIKEQEDAAAASSLNGNNEDLPEDSDRASDIVADMDFLNDSTTNNGGPNDPFPKSLGAEMEESIVQALSNLGVIYAKADKVLMLPLESEALREVVWWRYIGSAEGQEKWHVHIISFFMEQVPSLRRCEELPWHLFHCRRWFALKNTLVDLRTFDIMYNGNLQLRGELFNYWKTLIAGPLYINDDLESKAYQSKIELPQHQMMLDELDSASTLGLSDSQVRKERLRGQIAPFDICDEYNRAVEVWNNGVHPSTSRLEGMIMNISEFMAWFSHKMNALQEPPPFLRKTLNFEMLKDIGVDQKNVFGKLQLVGDGSNNSGSGSGEDGGNADDANNNNGAATPKNSDGAVATTEPANFSPEKYGSGGSGLLQPNFYFFNRWIWVMFPWLALKNAATYSDQMHK